MVVIALAIAVAQAPAARANAPIATTDPADFITETTAVLHGTLSTNGEVSATWAFELGVPPSLQLVTEPETADASADPQPESGLIRGLTPGTTYQYRLKVSSAGGTTRGALRTFKTKGTKPPPNVPPKTVLNVRRFHKASTVLALGLRGTVKVNKPVTATVELRQGNRVAGRLTLRFRSRGTRAFALHPDARLRRTLRSLRRGGSTLVRVRVRARDARGNTSTITRGVLVLR